MNAPVTLDLASLIRDMDAGAVIDTVDAMGLGRFIYHESLTIFWPRQGLDREKGLAVGRWLMANRRDVQRHFASQRGGSR
jgi:hypothetical protein